MSSTLDVAPCNELSVGERAEINHTEALTTTEFVERFLGGSALIDGNAVVTLGKYIFRCVISC
jgi:hypothetical protein